MMQHAGDAADDALDALLLAPDLALHPLLGIVALALQLGSGC